MICSTTVTTVLTLTSSASPSVTILDVLKVVSTPLSLIAGIFYFIYKNHTSNQERSAKLIRDELIKITDTCSDYFLNPDKEDSLEPSKVRSHLSMLRLQLEHFPILSLYAQHDKQLLEEAHNLLDRMFRDFEDAVMLDTPIENKTLTKNEAIAAIDKITDKAILIIEYIELQINPKAKKIS